MNNYCEHCGGRFTTQPGMIEKLCTCDIESSTEQKRGQIEPLVIKFFADIRFLKSIFLSNTFFWLGSALLYVFQLNEKWFSRLCLSLFCLAVFSIIKAIESKKSL